MDSTEWLIARTRHTIADTLVRCPDGRITEIAEIVARQLHGQGLLRQEDRLVPVLRLVSTE